VVPTILRQIRWSPDIVLLIEPTLFCAVQALLVARWADAKAWLHVQDFEIDAGFGLGELSVSRARELALAVERKIMSAFDRVSAISETNGRSTLGEGRPSFAYCLVSQLGGYRRDFPLEGPNPFRKELGIQESTVVALYSGSHGQEAWPGAARGRGEPLEALSRLTIYFLRSWTLPPNASG